MNLAFEAHHQSETLKVEKLREKNKALLKQSKTLEDELAERRTQRFSVRLLGIVRATSSVAVSMTV